MARRVTYTDFEKLLNRKIIQLYRAEKQAKKFPIHGKRRKLIEDECLVLKAEIRSIEVLKTDNMFNNRFLSDDMLKYRTQEAQDDDDTSN